MKKFLFTAAIASMAFVSASAQSGINQTTLWTFEQFQNDDNVASNVAVNYGNLYIVGHNETKFATISSKNNSTFKFGDYTYYVNYYLNGA